VHTYELALSVLEQEIAAEYYPTAPVVGKEMSGLLSTSWRLPFGFGAFLAGWLVDQFGSRRMLILYLLGCCVTCVISAASRPLAPLFISMFCMGAFASIYHPAGLAMISFATRPANRSHALGIHGIFGSIGISAAPFLIALAGMAGLSWRTCYLLLAIPAVLLAVLLVRFMGDHRLTRISPSTALTDNAEEGPAAWGSFFVLTLLASLQGFVYAGVMSFLPRYLAGWEPAVLSSGGASLLWRSRLLAAGVLLVGCVGQYLAGRWARIDRLERQLTWITLGNTPLLAWMAWAGTGQRVAAAAAFSLVHFMYQPIYNSLIAKYTPRHRRSLCYGFSFAMSFGIGSLGAAFAGFLQRQAAVYGTLALLAAVSGLFGLVLVRRQTNA
jgi:MFS transporter, FSR family, fosmidomycin resistance protein